jgi:hypothetical protein
MRTATIRGLLNSPRRVFLSARQAIGDHVAVVSIAGVPRRDKRNLTGVLEQAIAGLAALNVGFDAAEDGVDEVIGCAAVRMPVMRDASWVRGSHAGVDLAN